MPINKGKMRKKQQKNGFKTRVKVRNLMNGRNMREMNGINKAK